jgi:HEAT repeat protein
MDRREAVRHLGLLLRNPDPAVQMSGLSVVSNRRIRDAVPFVRRLLTSEHAGVRKMALYAAQNTRAREALDEVT